MKRTLCEQCQRPTSTCYCALITPVVNSVKVVVLQHPKEVNHSKGSLGLLAKSLAHCEVIIGECFNNSEQLKAVLTTYYSQICLLFPHENSTTLSISQVNSAEPWQCIILLDATWRKAFRMYAESTILHTIPHVHLPDGFVGQYHIRKTSKVNALSTLEACCYALSLLEGNNDKYQDLLKSFVKFNQIQLSFRR